LQTSTFISGHEPLVPVCCVFRTERWNQMPNAQAEVGYPDRCLERTQPPVLPRNMQVSPRPLAITYKGLVLQCSPQDFLRSFQPRTDTAQFTFVKAAAVRNSWSLQRHGQFKGGDCIRWPWAFAPRYKEDQFVEHIGVSACYPEREWHYLLEVPEFTVGKHLFRPPKGLKKTKVWNFQVFVVFYSKCIGKTPTEFA